MNLEGLGHALKIARKGLWIKVYHHNQSNKVPGKQDIRVLDAFLEWPLSCLSKL